MACHLCLMTEVTLQSPAIAYYTGAYDTRVACIRMERGGFIRTFTATCHAISLNSRQRACQVCAIKITALNCHVRLLACCTGTMMQDAAYHIYDNHMHSSHTKPARKCAAVNSHAFVAAGQSSCVLAARSKHHNSITNPATTAFWWEAEVHTNGQFLTLSDTNRTMIHPQHCSSHIIPILLSFNFNPMPVRNCCLYDSIRSPDPHFLATLTQRQICTCACEFQDNNKR